MSNADLADEIAEHSERQVRGLDWSFCGQCEMPWPCLVRRLADELEETTDAYHFWGQAHDEEIDRAMDAEARERRLADRLAASEALIERLLTMLPDPDKLLVLADWLDLKYPDEMGQGEVQQDLRDWAIGARVAVDLAGRKPQARPPDWLAEEQAALNALRCAAHGMKRCGACQEVRKPQPTDGGTA